MITKNALWKQICLGLKENARSENITAVVMKRIRNIKYEDQKVSTSKTDQ